MVLLKRKSFYPTAKVSVLFVKYSKRKRWPGCCGWLELLFLQVPLLRLCMISSYLDRLHKWILNNTAVLPSVYVKCSGTNYSCNFQSHNLYNQTSSDFCNQSLRITCCWLLLWLLDSHAFGGIALDHMISIIW